MTITATDMVSQDITVATMIVAEALTGTPQVIPGNQIIGQVIIIIASITTIGN